MDAELTLNLVYPCITILLSFIFYLLSLFYHGSRIHPYLPIWCTHESMLTTKRVVKAYPNTWLWAAPCLINMAQDQPFLGKDDENPYSHLNEFEQTCACLRIAGMLDETLRRKLFPFSLKRRAKQWYKQTIGSRQGDWEALCSSFCLNFFPISRVVSLHLEVQSFKQKEQESLGTSWERFNDLINTSPDLAI